MHVIRIYLFCCYVTEEDLMSWLRIYVEELADNDF